MLVFESDHSHRKNEVGTNRHSELHKKQKGHNRHGGEVVVVVVVVVGVSVVFSYTPVPLIRVTYSNSFGGYFTPKMCHGSILPLGKIILELCEKTRHTHNCRMCEVCDVFVFVFVFVFLCVCLRVSTHRAVCPCVLM